MKNFRSSQPCISMNFCTEFSKAQVFPVIIVNDMELNSWQDFFPKFVQYLFLESVFVSLDKSATQPATLLKKRLWYRCFPVNFVKFLGKPLLTEHLWWLLLVLQIGILRNFPISTRQYMC